MDNDYGYPCTKCTSAQYCIHNCDYNRNEGVECNSSNCGIANDCTNRQLTFCRAKKCKKVLEPQRGWGLQLLEDASMGDLIMEYAGEVIDTATKNMRTREKHDNYYIMLLEKGWYIDARNVGNLSRFINHSCAPNCVAERVTVRREKRCGIYATQDISANEFISIDYGNLTFQCACGSEKCSRSKRSGTGNVIQSVKRKRGCPQIYISLEDKKESDRNRMRISYQKKKAEWGPNKKYGPKHKQNPENEADMKQDKITDRHKERRRKDNAEAKRRSREKKKLLNDFLFNFGIGMAHVYEILNTVQISSLTCQIQRGKSIIAWLIDTDMTVFY